MPGGSSVDDKWLEDLVLELSAHGRQTLETNTTDEVFNLLWLFDAVALFQRVHEADLNTVFVEETSCECDTINDELEVIDSFSVLFEGHRTAVIDVKDHIVQC